MSTSTPVRTGLGTPGLRLAPVEVVIVRRLLYEMWKVARWFWPVAALITATIGAVIAIFTPITSSIWENAAQWPRWWLFAMAIALLVTYLPILVLQGVTRRAGLRALFVSGVLIAALWSLFMVAGHVVEKVIYDALGWPDVMETPHLFSDGYDVLPMFAEYGLVFLGYLFSGALVGSVYYRSGAIRGTLLLPLTLLPAVAMELLLSTGWVGSGVLDGLGIDRLSAVVLGLAALVVVGLTAAAVYLVVRDVPIHGKK